MGRATTPTITYLLLTPQSRVQFRVTSCKTSGVRIDRVSSSFFVFPLLIIIPPFLHTHLSPSIKLCDSNEQAARYQILCVPAGANSNRQLAGFGVTKKKKKEVKLSL
jgi:hypothetical protein